MKTETFVSHIQDALGRLNYEFTADHDGAYELFPIITVKDSKDGLTVTTTEGSDVFEITVKRIETD